MLQELELHAHPSAHYPIHNEGTRAASKPTDVKKRSIDLSFPGADWDDIQIAIRIRKLIVRGRRDELIAHSQCTRYELERSRGSQWIARHAFDRANRNRIRQFAKHLFYKLNLGRIQNRVSWPVSRNVI